MACFFVQTALLKGRDFELCNTGLYVFFEQRVWYSTHQKRTFAWLNIFALGFACLLRQIKTDKEGIPS